MNKYVLTNNPELPLTPGMILSVMTSRNCRLIEEFMVLEIIENNIYIAREYDDDEKENVVRYESLNGGLAWIIVPDWSGSYEVPKCICTKQPEG